MSGFIARLRPRTLQAWRVSGGGPIYRKIGRHVAYAVSDASVGAGARSRPNAVVIVPEGEKAADAAGRLLPDHAVVTSANGSKSAGKADWTVLTGRRVVMWPHADAPSATAAGAFRLQSGRRWTADGRRLAISTPSQLIENIDDRRRWTAWTAFLLYQRKEIPRMREKAAPGLRGVEWIAQGEGEI